MYLTGGYLGDFEFFFSYMSEISMFGNLPDGIFNNVYLAGLASLVDSTEFS